jgi:hypothetical protein
MSRWASYSYCINHALLHFRELMKYIFLTSQPSVPFQRPVCSFCTIYFSIYCHSIALGTNLGWGFSLYCFNIVNLVFVKSFLLILNEKPLSFVSQEMLSLQYIAHGLNCMWTSSSKIAHAMSEIRIAHGNKWSSWRCSATNWNSVHIFVSEHMILLYMFRLKVFLVPRCLH